MESAIRQTIVPRGREMKFKPFKAWAVVDVTGVVKPSGFDVFHSREQAALIAKIRSGANYPRHPSAKWRVFRVTVRVD